jgi:hypothetical protein
VGAFENVANRARNLALINSISAMKGAMRLAQSRADQAIE